ncbi:MAG TPA: tetratricopeptide repeat protein, partial [Blastocatellia bacterium]
DKSARKGKKKDEAAALPESASFAPQPAEESGKKNKKSKKSESTGKNKKKDEETQGADEEQDGKKSKSGKGKKSDKESSKKSQDGEIKARSLAGVISAAQSSAPNAAGPGDAIRDAELAIQKDGNLAEAHIALGFALLADGKEFDRALGAFVRASTIAPEDPEAYFGVGYAYRLKQQCDQAIPQLKKAIELRPDYYEAQRELAYCYHSTGATDLAIRQYVVATSYRAQTKDSSEYAANNLALGALYRKKGDEIGGVQGEEFRKVGKACEDDARKEEPDLKRAAKRLGAAGVLRLVEEKAPPEIRPFLQGFNFLNGGKSSINSKPSVGVKIPIGKGSSIGVGIPIKVPLGSKSPKGGKIRTPKGGKIRTPANAGAPARIPLGTKTPKRQESKPAPKPTPRPEIKTAPKPAPVTIR